MARSNQSNTPSGEDAVEVTQTPAEAGGIEAAGVQVKPTEKVNADVKSRMTNEADKDLHPAGEPPHPADKTSAPNAVKTELDNPPYNTGRPDEPIIGSLVTGAGAHVPPDPEKYDADGRPKLDN